jgi:hypothetical protein
MLVHPAVGAIRASRAPAVALPGGRVLMTLMSAGNYIAKLPEAEHSAEEWQMVAVEQASIAKSATSNFRASGLPAPELLI